MKNILLGILLLASVAQAQAQERFFKLIEGWHCQQIYNLHNKYYSIGLGEDNLGNYNFQFNRISLDGVIDSTWILDLPQYIDESYPFSDAVTTDNNQILVGGVAYDSLLNRSAIYLTFNEDFTQNIKVVDLNLGYNSMTYTPHIKSNGHKVMGRTYQVGGAGTDVVAQLLEVDENDSLLWIKSFFPANVTNTDWLQPRQLLTTADNGYLLICSELHFSNNGDSKRPVLIKTDSLGVQQWRRYVGDTNYLCEGGYAVASPEGGWLVAWSAPYDIAGDANREDGIHIEKLRPNGSTAWSKHLGWVMDYQTDQYNYFPKQFQALPDGNYLVSGYMFSKAFLLKVSPLGDPIWYRVYADPYGVNNNVIDEVLIYSTTPTSDGGFICAGEYRSDPGGLFPNFIQSAFAMKLDEYGCLEPGCQVVDAVEEVEVVQAPNLVLYPNPSKDIVNIKYSTLTEGAVILKIVNTQGAVVYQSNLKNTSDEISLQLGGLPNGLYQCILICGSANCGHALLNIQH